MMFTERDRTGQREVGMVLSDSNGHASPWGESFHNSFVNDRQKGMGPG